MQKVHDLIKCIIKAVLFVVLMILICVAVDNIFENILSITSKGVLANFIIFSTIILLVMRSSVHPIKLMEEAQVKVVASIEDSENVKTDSEVKLSSIEESVKNLNDDIEQIINKSEENAKIVGEKTIEDGQKTALTIQENTNKAIENSKTILKNDLIKRASLASIDVAKNQILGELYNNQDLHNKLIDESIEALEGVEL